MGKTDSTFPMDIGFICDTAPVTADMLNENIKSHLILMAICGL